jgi:hypothetical protein
MAGYVLRYPELAAKSKAVGGEIEMDSAVGGLHGESTLKHSLTP